MKMFKKLVLPALLGLSLIGNAHANWYANSKEIVNAGYEIHARCDLSIIESEFWKDKVGNEFKFYYVYHPETKQYYGFQNYHFNSFFRMELLKDKFRKRLQFRSESKGSFVEETIFISQDLNKAVFMYADPWFIGEIDWVFVSAGGPCTWFK